MIRPGTKIDILGDIMAGPLKLSARVWALICHWDGACIARKNEITARSCMPTFAQLS
jgi:hypothetical protein